MKRRGAVTILGLGVVVALGCWLWRQLDVAGTPAVAPATDAPPAGEKASADQAAGGMTTEAGVRVQAATSDETPRGPADRATGSLVVKVTWSDRTPAADVAVHVATRWPALYRILGREATDTAGIARFPRLPAGLVTVGSDRGDRRLDKVEIVAGREQEVRLELEAGVEVAGTVRDAAGRPVGGAGIWLTAHQMTWIGGRIVARSDASGAFRLRDVPAKQSLGALARGYAPSDLVDLETLDVRQQPVRVDLVVTKPGGALAGQVVDARGQGVAAAIVAVGSAEYPIDRRVWPRTAERWSVRTCVTDGEGRFELDCLAPGEHPVEVSSALHPFWHGKCTMVAGETAKLEIQLADGVTVHGIVRGTGGAPLPGAIVRAFPVAIQKTYLQGGQYDYESVFGYPHAVAGADGRYRLEQVAPGRIHLFAGPGGQRKSGEPVPWDEMVLEAADGATLQWDPLVGLGLTIEGVVLYREGAPMNDVFVIAVESGSVANRVVNTTDREGRFRLVRLEDKPYDVEVQLWSPPPEQLPLARRGVRPGGEPLRFVAVYDAPEEKPTGRVRGRVLDAAGRLRGKLGVVLRTVDGSRSATRLEGETFYFERLPAGRYQLQVMSGEESVHAGPWFELARGEDKDLGTVVTEPGGSLLVSIEREPGTETAELSLSLRHESGAYRSAKPGVANQCRIDNLSAGSHRITAYGSGGVAAANGSCRVAAGAETAATIRLRRAVVREVAIDFAADQRLRYFHVKDQDGACFIDGNMLRPVPAPYSMKLRLPLGRYTLRGETSTGAANEIAFEMRSLDPDQPAVVLKLRP